MKFPRLFHEMVATERAVADWSGPVVVKCRAHWHAGQVQQHRIEALHACGHELQAQVRQRCGQRVHGGLQVEAARIAQRLHDAADIAHQPASQSLQQRHLRVAFSS